MKSDSNKVNFSEETGITDEVLQAHLRGKLNSEQQTLFLQLLEQDEFAQDALKGLEERGIAEETYQQVVKSIEARSGYKKEESVITFRVLLAAASLALLMGCGWWLWQMNSQTETISNNAPIQPVQPLALTTKDSMPQQPNVVGATDTAMLAMNQPAESQSTDLIQTIIPQTASPEEKTVASSAEVQAEERAGAMAVAGDQITDKAEAPASSRAPQSRVMAADSRKEINREEAKRKLELRQYEKAGADYRQLLSEAPDDAELLYYGGICEYILGNNDQAEKHFDRLLQGKRGFTEGSLWYKANILLKKGKKDQGLDMLRNLAEKTGPYQERAKKKLQESRQ